MKVEAFPTVAADMKLFLAAVLLVAVEAASLGGDHCTWGPSYWCGSLQAASSCDAVSHCLKTVWKPLGPRPVQPTKECAYSQKLVETIRHVLPMDKRHRETRYLIATMCSFIGNDAFRKECKGLVMDFLPEIIKLVESGLEPSSVATVMGLCKPHDNKAVGVGKSPHVKVLVMDQDQASRLPQKKPVAEKNQARLSPKDNKSVKDKPAKEEKVGNDAECDICKFALKALDQLLGENRTEEAIRQGLDSICQDLPANITAQCKAFVDEYAVTVIKLLVQELDPQKVCVALGLCQPSAELSAPRQTAGSLCPLCEVLIGILEEMISNNKSEMAIEKALDKVCSLFPATVGSECISLVKAYGPAIIDLLQQEITPQQVCEKIHLCNSSSLIVPVALPKAEHVGKESADSAECDLCKVIITEINNLIGDNKTEQAIIHAVEKVCDVVSGDLRLQCQSEVENYGPAVLDLLKHMDDPAQVCTYLHMCTATSPANSSPHNKQVMIGRRECTYGPSFWCASLENARKCGMEQECMLKYGLKP